MNKKLKEIKRMVQRIKEKILQGEGITQIELDHIIGKLTEVICDERDRDEKEANNIKGGSDEV